MQTNIKWPLMNNNLLREDLDSVIELLKQEDPKLTNGPKVREFEGVWSKWLGVKYSVMLNSGASANDLTLLALKEMFGPSEVIVPALTWVSDVASVLNAGHTPIFVDINLKTLGMATDLILKSITPKTKAVFLTHVLGFNALTRSFFFCRDHPLIFFSRSIGRTMLSHASYVPDNPSINEFRFGDTW